MSSLKRAVNRKNRQLSEQLRDARATDEKSQSGLQQTFSSSAVCSTRQTIVSCPYEIDSTAARGPRCPFRLIGSSGLTPSTVCSLQCPHQLEFDVAGQGGQTACRQPPCRCALSANRLYSVSSASMVSHASMVKVCAANARCYS